jgi:hypothetical protein
MMQATGQAGWVAAGAGFFSAAALPTNAPISSKLTGTLLR